MGQRSPNGQPKKPTPLSVPLPAAHLPTADKCWPATLPPCVTATVDSKMPAQPTGITVKDVDVHKFNRAYAQFLKNSGKVEIPKWVDIVKTGVHKELSPYDPDWFYIRIASIARHVYMRSPVGVGALTRIYGGKKRRGVCPGKFAKSSGSIARAGLAQLEKMKLIQKAANGLLGFWDFSCSPHQLQLDTSRYVLPRCKGAHHLLQARNFIIDTVLWGEDSPKKVELEVKECGVPCGFRKEAAF